MESGVDGWDSSSSVYDVMQWLSRDEKWHVANDCQLKSISREIQSTSMKMKINLYSTRFRNQNDLLKESQKKLEKFLRLIL